MIHTKPERDEALDAILQYFAQMTPDQQVHFRVIARAFVEGRSASSRRGRSDTPQALGDAAKEG